MAPITNGVSTGPSSHRKATAATASAAQLTMRRCDDVRPIEGPGGRERRQRSMQARRIAVAELDQSLVDGEAVARLRHVLEVGAQVGDGLAHRAQLGGGEAAI